MFEAGDIDADERRDWLAWLNRSAPSSIASTPSRAQPSTPSTSAPSSSGRPAVERGWQLCTVPERRAVVQALARRIVLLHGAEPTLERAADAELVE